jgi:hypothetical protein
MRSRRYKKYIWLVVAAAFAVGASFAGVPQEIFAADKSYLSLVIGGMFLIGLWAVITNRWKTVNWLAEEMLSVGLIGTVVGFIIAFSGMDPTAALDAEGAKNLVAKLISGMGTALYTTLVGSVGYVWLSLQAHLFYEEKT